MNGHRKFVLSGAISNHETEASVYFKAAEEALRERYPLAEVFNPTRLPQGMTWRQYMVICLTRINGWATDIVYIRNEYYNDSKGANDEREAAQKHNLGEHVYRDRVLTELPREAQSVCTNS